MIPTTVRPGFKPSTMPVSNNKPMKFKSSEFATNATPQEQSFEAHGWTFTSIKTPILNQTEYDDLKEELDVFALPEQTFNSSLTISKGGFKLNFNAKDALRFARDEIVDKNEHIQKIKVGCSSSWTNKKIPSTGSEESSTDVTERDDKIDWTFTTLYKGSLDLDSNVNKNLVTRKATEKIDYELLKRKDDILFYDDVILYEDELHDHGMSHCTVKVRVMDHSFYCLLRYFLRVDGVCIRCVDTRLFHKFGDSENSKIVREFSIRESSWKDLQSNISFNVQYSQDQSIVNNPNLLMPMLKLKEETTDVITIE